MIIEESVYLEHFGVKGMHWGQRKEKEVTPEERAKREGKAKKFDARAEMFQTRIDELKAYQPKSNFQRQALNAQIQDTTKFRDTALKDAEAKRQGKLSTGQKKLVKGAAIAGAIVVAYGAYTTANSGQMRQAVLNGQNFISGKKGGPTWKTKPSLADKSLDANGIMQHVVKDINPSYGGIGTKMNCRRGTYAYEMRRRGYDVAATRTTNASGQNIVGVINATSPGKKILPTSRTGIVRALRKEAVAVTKNENMTESAPITTALKLGQWGKEVVPKGSGRNDMTNGVFEAIASHPNGARGEFAMEWGSGGAHSMAWEMINGKAHIFDTQNGQHYTDGESLASSLFSKGLSITKAGISRLDDVPMNDAFLTRWLKNAS